MEYIVAVIDATGVRSGRTEPNKEILKEHGFLIMDQVKTTITREQSLQFTTTSAQEYDFTSGPVVALKLRKNAAYTKYEQIKDNIDDTYASIDTWTTLRDSRLFFPVTPTLERTLVLVKPEYSQDDYTRILQTIDDNDFHLIGKLARIVSNDVANEMFNNNEEDVRHVTSDVSVALVIEKVGAVDDWHLLMGPTDPSLSNLVAPDALRSTLGATSYVHNVVYGSESAEKAGRDIAALFPAPFQMERTLAIVKPDVVANGQFDAVMEVITANRFTILSSEEVSLSAQKAAQFLGEEATDEAVKYLCSGPSKVMILGKPGAAVAWQKLVGPLDPETAVSTKPNSLVARFGSNIVCNGFHASVNVEVAEKEIDFFFPQIRRETLPTLLQVEDTLNKKAAPRPHVEQQQSLSEVLTTGLTHLCRVKPIGNDAVVWLAEWLMMNNPNKPVVGPPVVVEMPIGVLEQIELNTGSPVDLVWALGSPGSGRDENVDIIADNYGYQVLDILQLLQVSAASGSEYGELIKDCKVRGRPVPTHVAVNLVRDAMLNSRKFAKFVVKGFPSSMDEALLFEEVVGHPTKIIYFDCTDGTKDARIHTMKGDKEAIDAEVLAFKQDVYPIVTQYQLHGKVKKISTDGPNDLLLSRIKKLFR